MNTKKKPRRQDRAHSRNSYKQTITGHLCNICGAELVRSSKSICKQCEAFIYKKLQEDL